MKIPLSWLKEYVDFSLSPAEVGEVLTLAGLEVEKIEEISPGFEGVVVAKVLETSPHPNADRLKVAKVNDGSETFSVVCGAPNCREGLIVALAKIGARLQDEKGKSFKIKKSKLRDVESFGMLCSEVELGLGEGSEGIMELDPALSLGSNFKSLYTDIVFEISLTPNLGHCMSILGVARELSAMLDLPLKLPKNPLQEDPSQTSPDLLSLSVTAPEECYQYGARVLTNVSVGPSPFWLQLRLESSGIRSINNVVDVTNYVMLELGQPMHAFDGDSLSSSSIQVEKIPQEISFVTLDERDRKIPSGTLMITDGKRPLAIAGIMGGKESSVGENTRNVLLEAAYFDPLSVRKTSKNLALRSESSARFEKEIDPLGIEPALDRAAYLLQEFAGARVAEGIAIASPKPFTPHRLTCRVAKINRLLGIRLSASEVKSLLDRLGIPAEEKGEEEFVLTIPSYRNDIKAEIDIIEEVARIYGYNNINPRPLTTTITAIPHSPSYFFIRRVRDHLLCEGLQEFMTCDLISPEQAGLTQAPAIPVLHPSSVDQSLLRTSLLPGLLQSIRQNQDFKWNQIAAFEMGKTHEMRGEAHLEKEKAAIVLAGDRSSHSWTGKGAPFDFFDLKGMVENLFEGLHLPMPEFSLSSTSFFHPTSQADLLIDSKSVGHLAEIHPTLLLELGIAQKVFFAEIDLQALQELYSPQRQMEPLPQFPGSERDWTLTLRSELPMEALFKAVEECQTPLLTQTQLLDIYQSEKLGSDRKNVTLRFTYRDSSKTLNMQDVEDAHKSLQAGVKHKLSSSIFQADL